MTNEKIFNEHIAFHVFFELDALPMKLIYRTGNPSDNTHYYRDEK